MNNKKWRQSFARGIFLSTVCLWYGLAWGDFHVHQVTHLKDPDQFELLILGDTYYGESYKEVYQRKRYDYYIDKVGDAFYDHGIEQLQGILNSADFRVANLAASITNLEDESGERGKKQYLHRADIEGTPNALKRHKIDAVALGNSHAMDYGTGGLFQTQDLLMRKGILNFGAGRNRNAAWEPLVLETRFTNGKVFRVALISGLEERKSYRSAGFDYYAGPHRPGVALLTEFRVKKVVKRLRKQFGNDIFIIVFPHWGRDYEKRTSRQLELGNKLKALKINALIGHGSHTSHPIDIQKNKLVAYSIGNFIFNSAGRYEKAKALPYSMMVKVIKSSETDNVVFRFYPFFSNNILRDEKSKDTIYQPFSLEKGMIGQLLTRLNLDQRTDMMMGRDAQSEFFQFEISETLD